MHTTEFSLEKDSFIGKLYIPFQKQESSEVLE